MGRVQWARPSVLPMCPLRQACRSSCLNAAGPPLPSQRPTPSKPSLPRSGPRAAFWPATGPSVSAGTPPSGSRATPEARVRLAARAPAAPCSEGGRRKICNQWMLRQGVLSLGWHTPAAVQASRSPLQTESESPTSLKSAMVRHVRAPAPPLARQDLEGPSVAAPVAEALSAQTLLLSLGRRGDGPASGQPAAKSAGWTPLVPPANPRAPRPARARSSVTKVLVLPTVGLLMGQGLRSAPAPLQAPLQAAALGRAARGAAAPRPARGSSAAWPTASAGWTKTPPSCRSLLGTWYGCNAVTPAAGRMAAWSAPAPTEILVPKEVTRPRARPAQRAGSRTPSWPRATWPSLSPPLARRLCLPAAKAQPRCLMASPTLQARRPAQPLRPRLRPRQRPLRPLLQRRLQPHGAPAIPAPIAGCLAGVRAAHPGIHRRVGPSAGQFPRLRAWAAEEATAFLAQAAATLPGKAPSVLPFSPRSVQATTPRMQRRPT